MELLALAAQLFQLRLQLRKPARDLEELGPVEQRRLLVEFRVGDQVLQGALLPTDLGFDLGDAGLERT